MTSQTSRDLLAYVEDDIRDTWFELHANRKRRAGPIAGELFADMAVRNAKRLKELFAIRRRERVW